MSSSPCAPGTGATLPAASSGILSNIERLVAELDRAEESLVPILRKLRAVHVEVGGNTLLKRTGRSKLLEGTLGQVDVVLLAASALVNDTNVHTARDLLVAETNKVTAGGTVLPATRSGTNVRRVLGVPRTVTTGRRLQVVRRVPSDLDVALPVLVTVRRLGGEEVLLLRGELVVRLTSKELEAVVTFTLALGVVLVTSLGVEELDLLAVNLNGIMGANHRDHCGNRNERENSNLSEASHCNVVF